MENILGTGLLLDMRRLFVRRKSANVWNLLLENIAQPILIAGVVAIVFLWRDEPSKHTEPFIYFSTLYAFWIGLFGSCQAINSELRNSEWSYWVLGMNRSKIVHLLAILIVNIIFAWLQVGVFLCVFALLHWLPWDSTQQMAQTFIDNFVGLNDVGADFLKMKGLLQFVLIDTFGSYGPLGFSLCLFGVSLLVASVSGVGFGLFLSACFKDPTVSLNISVGCVVLMGILSHSGLSPFEGDLEQGTHFEPNLPTLAVASSDGANSETASAGQAESPSDLDYKPLRKEKFSESSSVYWLAQFSEILPQRYFFNIGRLTNALDFSFDEIYKTRLREHYREESMPPWLRENEKVGSAKWPFLMQKTATKKWGVPKKWRNYLEDEYNDLEKFCQVEDRTKRELDEMQMRHFFAKAHEEFPEVLEGCRFDLYWRIMANLFWNECWPIFVIFAVCLVATVVLVETKEVYHVLR